MKATNASPAYLKAFTEIVLRIQSSLAGSRSQLKEPVRIFVAGGAAVHAYSGARISADIDATLSRRVLLPENLEVSYRDRDGTARVLYFDRQYNDTLGLLHENAYADSIAMDIEGIDRSLAQAGLLNAGKVRHRAEEALAGGIGDTGMVRIALDEACEIIRTSVPRKRK